MQRSPRERRRKHAQHDRRAALHPHRATATATTAAHVPPARESVPIRKSTRDGRPVRPRSAATSAVRHDANRPPPAACWWAPAQSTRRCRQPAKRLQARRAYKRRSVGNSAPFITNRRITVMRRRMSGRPMRGRIAIAACNGYACSASARMPTLMPMQTAPSTRGGAPLLQRSSFARNSRAASSSPS